MSNSMKNFPVEGTAALRVDDTAAEPTRIISFPAHARRPLHAKPKSTVSDDGMINKVLGNDSSAILNGEMTSSLRNGTCKGKAVGGLTSLQAAGASLVFFVFLMGTLLFV